MDSRSLRPVRPSLPARLAITRSGQEDAVQTAFVGIAPALAGGHRDMESAACGRPEESVRCGEPARGLGLIDPDSSPARSAPSR